MKPASLFRNIPRSVIALGVVSLFTDFSSEMIYPFLPVFLSSILGAGAFALGLIEGIAETTASVLKIVSGYLTDRTAVRKPFVLAGYSLSSAMRPLIGLAGVWPVVLLLRFFDRVGKGVRTSPRDALIADATLPRYTGRAYGFHRAMDHAGAVIGPLAAAFLMKALHVPIRGIFLISAVPALVVVLVLIFFVQEKKRVKPTPGEKFSEVLSAGRLAGKSFRLFMLSVVIFTLGNSTDAFLLLRLSRAGVDTAWIALLWSLLHMVKMTSSFLFGRASDAFGRKPMILAGWMYYALIYFLFAAFTAKGTLITVFILYGIYFGLTEPAEKSLVAALVPGKKRGKAFGLYNGAVGIASLPASLIFGAVWQRFGYHYAFITGAFFSLIGCAVLFRVTEQPERRR